MTKATTKAVSTKVAKAVENKEVIKTPAAVTKADKARVILGQSYGNKEGVPARKDIIGRLVAEAALTPAGAATYLQNYKRKNGLSKSKAVPATA